LSPIAILLQTTRLKHQISQTELAERIGYEQTYISALELDKKGPPSAEFITRFSRALSLPEQTCEQLHAAAEASQRKIVIRHELPEEVYWMLAELREQLPTLCARRARVIREILDLDKVEKTLAQPVSGRPIRRRRKKVVTM
jgi:transcriptional regulator with XRE-family HTH domain